QLAVLDVGDARAAAGIERQRGARAGGVEDGIRLRRAVTRATAGIVGAGADAGGVRVSERGVLRGGSGRFSGGDDAADQPTDDGKNRGGQIYQPDPTSHSHPLHNATITSGSTR